MKLLILAVLLMVKVHATPLANMASNTTSTILKEGRLQGIYAKCDAPNDITTAARNLLRRYFNGQMYNSSLYDNFLWLHPEYVEFISCVICSGGRPNDPYWESEFIIMCDERESETLYVNDENAVEENSLL
ncbi:MAG: hypothetical protein K9K67_04885 [Bacteriovoracaceae bacterium]|nr:hypothetical protein [Bacteriovoracaceae bacterium]